MSGRLEARARLKEWIGRTQTKAKGVFQHKRAYVYREGKAVDDHRNERQGVGTSNLFNKANKRRRQKNIIIIIRGKGRDGPFPRPARPPKTFGPMVTQGNELRIAAAWGRFPPTIQISSKQLALAFRAAFHGMESGHLGLGRISQRLVVDDISTSNEMICCGQWLLPLVAY